MAAYFVLHNRITDDEKMQQYIPQAVGSIMEHGGEILVVADDSTVVEGETEFPRTVVVRFDSREKAQAWYDGAEYSGVRPLRLAATEGYGLLVDGFQMPG